MSSDDRDVPQFDDFDLPDETGEAGNRAAEPTDNLAEPTEAMPGPGEDTAPPIEGTTPDAVVPGDAPTEEYAGPLPAGLAALPGGELQTPDDEDKDEEEEEEEEKKSKRRREGLFAKLAAAGPFTVMLAISLTAIVVSILLLFLELQQYNFDTKAKEAQQRVGAAPAVQLASPSTTAAA